MSTCHELKTDMHKERKRNFEEKNIGEVTGIRIHPKWFNELAADKESVGKIELNISEHEHPALVFHKFEGISLIITKEVEKWDFIFKERD